jgi:DnaJ-class molecular chaperone
VTDEKPQCTWCNGEGQVANSEQREPWSTWASLPIGSDLAVQLGLVKPIPCEVCDGTGDRKEKSDE